MKKTLVFRFCSALLVAVITLVLVQGCTKLTRRAAVPVALQTQAQVPGLSGVRFRVGTENSELVNEGLASIKREQAYLALKGHTGPLPPAMFLAISGGGDNGAFAAGLLNGWTAAGNRPQFKLVTGISTGALIAPFAFLGSAYDAKLKEFYTTISAKDVMEKRNILAAVTSDAMADNLPLWEQLEKHINRQLLDAIAVEYDKGRLLLVATADLDARNAIIWNMTKIAASRDPKALKLFRAIIIASAAIPGLFPPVMIDVEANGQRHQEMHVDGGTMAQVFVYPPSMKLREIGREARIERKRRLYIIRNSRLDPDWASVERKTISIAQRAISSLIQTQGIGDLYRIYLIAQRDDVDYNLAYIPSSFNVPKKEDFDTEYMQQLFGVGYEMAAKGYPWQKMPPGYTR